MTAAEQQNKYAAADWNRRAAKRFPIQQTISYKITHGKGVLFGSGMTVNIACRRLLLTTHPFLVGGLVEASVSWPARLSETCAPRSPYEAALFAWETGRAAMLIENTTHAASAS
jgi:hypothetical protein